MRKGIFLALVLVIIGFVAGAIYLKAQEGSLSQDIIRISVDGAFDPEEVIVAKNQSFEFYIYSKSGKQVSFVDVESDLFLGKKGHIIPLVGELEPGEHTLEMVSSGNSIFKKSFGFTPKVNPEAIFSIEEGDVSLKRKIVNGKMELALTSKKNLSVEIDEYIAQGLVASSSMEFTSLVKNGLQDLRFSLDLKAGEEKIIEYVLQGGKDSNFYSFGPAEVNELVKSKIAENIRQSRRKLITESGIIWLSGKRLSWAEDLVGKEQLSEETGWLHVGKLLIRSTGNRIIYKADSAGSEASYEVDSTSDVDNVPLLLDKYKAFVLEGKLTVYEVEKREEEGSEKVNYNQLFP
jgi:hypothetical protein